MEAQARIPTGPITTNEEAVAVREAVRDEFDTYTQPVHMEHAVKIAEEMTRKLGFLCVAADRGPSVSPRYKVIRAYQVGDVVSETLNGDYNTLGKVSRVSDAGTAITVEVSVGEKRQLALFYRRGKSAAWVRHGFNLVLGRHDERNPHV
jgi:hypothetical protein